MYVFHLSISPHLYIYISWKNPSKDFASNSILLVYGIQGNACHSSVKGFTNPVLQEKLKFPLSGWDHSWWMEGNITSSKNKKFSKQKQRLQKKTLLGRSQRNIEHIANMLLLYFAQRLWDSYADIKI